MTNIKPAERLASVSEYYFSRKGKEIAALEADGHDIISLAIGSPDMPPSEATIKTLAQEASRPNAHGYQPTRGIKELRTQMAAFYERTYGVSLDAETEVQPLIGSKEGILHITLALVNPGDEVLVPDPGYPTYSSLSTLLGAKVVKYNLTATNHWQPDFQELEHLVTPRTRILWSNYPHMPTGAKAQRETYERLVQFAKRHSLVVVNDNPYSFILNHDRLSILQIEGAKDCCIELNSMSKSHNMPGWRVGMLMTNATLISWILKVKSNIDSGTLRPLQLAAAKALQNDAQWHERANITTYAKRRAIAEQIMDTLGCTYDKESVGMFLWGRIPKKYDNAETLTERVLHEADVFITPGFIFGNNGERYIRISLCAKDERMQQALERIKKMTI